MPTLAHIGEDELVRRLTTGLPLDRSVLAGAGDDCAVLHAPPPGRHLLFKTDAVVEHIHFLRETPPRAIGRKALARVISDIAAMGGQPTHALITLVVRRATELRFIEELYSGVREVAQTFGVNIVGGETSRGDTTVISVSLLGQVSARRWSNRRGGKAGDALLVTGRLGGSIKGRHLDFTPRVKEAQWLVKKFTVHAMMDISDGLAKDLPRLAEASGVEFVVDESALPCTPGCTPGQAWGDGEDYELLLAVSPNSAARLETEWPRAFPKLELTRIGKFVAKGQGIAPSFATKGWDHFAGNS
ncbi:MAG: thiamine-phosphate kinase [Verrucomicrobiaceae bacterium]|nr:thiamine-phosphate kinase [Verrucomicrobiaceae bacterium]